MGRPSGRQKKTNLEANANEQSCNLCNKTKPLNDFIKDLRNINGRGGRCRQCTNDLKPRDLCGCGESKWVISSRCKKCGRDATRTGLGGRIKNKPIRDEITGCLLWQGYVNPVSGYVAWNGKYAHRVVYEQNFGPIPDGYEVDHVYARGCRYKHCIEPSHLEAVSKLENKMRQSNMIIRMAATHCSNGHEYNEKNTRLVKNPGSEGRGTRECRTCDAIWHKEARERKKREVLSIKPVGFIPQSQGVQ